ncbi:MAG: hypothetical protein GY743_14620 [Planctomycetaceae bacterium]|nr:hypothetical protein [Planctomycetaceae bacterium]
MAEYLIRPKAPLLFRNAKPFASGEGGAETLPFPSPATISGAMRTAWAEQQKKGLGLEYTKENAELLRKKQVLGPLLVSEKPGCTQLLMPAPRDSLCLENTEGEQIIYRIVPKTLGEGEGCDLPNESLLPLYLKTDDTSKPAADAPAFWYLKRLIDWLADDMSNTLTAKGQGIGSLPIEYRTHVAIDPTKSTAKDAHLFETAGLDFSQQRKAVGGWDSERFALLADFQDGCEIQNDYRTVGGEARLGFIERTEGLWPACPERLTTALSRSKGCRLYLATPAIFTNGWLPGFIDPKTLEGKLHNVKLKLRAAAVPRWEAGTSWDMTQSSGGKGMRTTQRMAAAGSVYWFEIQGENTAVQLCESWLTSISDCREKDGFGLVLPGVWNPPE